MYAKVSSNGFVEDNGASKQIRTDLVCNAATGCNTDGKGVYRNWGGT